MIHEAIGERSRTTKSVPWRRILRSRTLWFLSAMYFCYGYAFAVYVLWFPTYLKDGRGFSLTQMGYLASCRCLRERLEAAGGWLSDVWLKRSGNLARSRRIIGSAGFALAGAAIIPAALTSDPMTCVWFSCLAMFGLEFTVA